MAADTTAQVRTVTPPPTASSLPPIGKTLAAQQTDYLSEFKSAARRAAASPSKKNCQECVEALYQYQDWYKETQF